MEADTARPFHFEHLPIRGVWVRLRQTWREVQSRHHYPPALRTLLGETLAAGALLGAAVKPPARLTLELRGSGALRFVVADVWEGQRVRAIARWREPLPDGPLPVLLGTGQALITLEPAADGPRYQGVVPALAGDLASVLESYFEQSEQLPTRVLLRADAHTAAALLVQRLPGASEAEDAHWQVRAQRAADAAPLLLEHDAIGLLRWLYPRDDLRVHDARPLRFGCSCSLERVHGVLRAMGRADLQDLLAERGAVTVDCEFCNEQYRFDAPAIAALFDAGAAEAGAAEAGNGATRH